MAVLKNCSEDFHLMFISLLNWNNNSNGDDIGNGDGEIEILSNVKERNVSLEYC